MEEDINILDEVVGRSKELREKDFGMLIGTKEMQSIENLLKGYRELEERIIYLVNERKKLEELLFMSNENYIEKSKVKEKIEEYKKLGNEFYEKFLETNKTDIDIHDAGISCDAKVQVLQELMEDK